MLALVESPGDLVTQILLQRNAARLGLGRRVPSEGEHRSSQQRECLSGSSAVIMLTPRALDDTTCAVGWT
jgi:hypothetical protein